VALVFGHWNAPNVQSILEELLGAQFSIASFSGSHWHELTPDNAYMDLLTCVSTNEDILRDLSTVNKTIPSNIVLYNCEIVPKDFHADMKIHTRAYEYFLPLNIFEKSCNWEIFVEKVTPILKLFTGRHSFHNFTSAKIDVKSPQALVDISQIHRRRRFQDDRPFIVFSFRARAFLKDHIPYMVSLIYAFYHDLLPIHFLKSAFSTDKLCFLPKSAPSDFLLFLMPVYQSSFSQYAGKKKVKKEDGYVKGEIYQHLSQNCDCFIPWIEEVRRDCKKIAESLRVEVQSQLNCSINKFVPPVYRNCLEELRKLDQSGNWPQISAGRAKVVKSTGRSGSFGLGFSPLQPPRNNFLDLMHAIFQLEEDLMPGRRSSTVAVNKHAQFKPHVDTGSGSGQSDSLIVGLGDYVGGELFVEDSIHDIRYKPLTFNGWTQRHYTKVFEGERYSLVFFTPLGCEGKSGLEYARTMMENSWWEYIYSWWKYFRDMLWDAISF